MKGEVCPKISLLIDLKLKTAAVDAPIDLTWRTVDAYQRAFKTRTRGRPVAQGGGA